MTEVGLVTTIGLAAGMAHGAAASRFITTLLYDVKPSDLSNIAAPLACLLLAGALAAGIPVRRATRVDPATALRYE